MSLNTAELQEGSYIITCAPSSEDPLGGSFAETLVEQVCAVLTDMYS